MKRVAVSVVDPAGMEVEMSKRMVVVGRGHEVMSRYSALLLAVLRNRSARLRLDRGGAGSSLRRRKVGSPQDTRRPSGFSGELVELDAHPV